jgi:hypothetical protein
MVPGIAVSVEDKVVAVEEEFEKRRKKNLKLLQKLFQCTKLH